MNQEISFGRIVREHRQALDLTQAELARRVGCATVTVRKIEYDALRPSQQIAELLAKALNIPLEERARFVRLGRMALRDTPEPSPLPTPAPAPEEIGQEDLSGRAIRGYDLGERIGAGGFGAVYRAIQPVIEREVAIKIILPQYANHPDFIRRFEAEAQLVARLEHPYIVPLYDYWREPGVAYLVMRLLRGGSLGDALKDGPLSLETVAVLLEQVGAALHAAHRVGVIHRDLKPANVLLDDDGNGYLADFGIAKNLSDPDMENLTQVGAMVGSPAYSSPEQIRSEMVKPQADIYCLGVLVYELLAGQKPFQGPTPMDYVMQHLNEPLPPLAALPFLDPIIQQATAKDPLDRYPDVPSLVADFRQAVATQSAMVIPKVPHGIALLDEELENPYKGLRPFREADADDFFGRETLIQELLTRLADADERMVSSRQDLGRFLAVVGPSGSGKSSTVKAGLIPALRRGGLPGSENWFIVGLIPGAHPLEELEAALLRIAVNPPESLLAQLREDERGLLRAVQRVLPADPNIELVLIIDQFEEIFTQVADETVRAHLLDSLLTAVLDERSRVRVIITLRADFTDRPLQYVDFGDLVRQRTAFVLPLTPDELEQAIVGPAARMGLVVDPGLVATMVQDVGDQPGMLPLLQYALTELFELGSDSGWREGRTLTLAAYQESGGVTGALGRRAEELYGNLEKATQACPESSRREAARQLFLRLVTLGEGAEDTRRRVLRTELSALKTREVSETPRVLTRALNDVIETYGRYRLLTFDHDPVTRGPTVEVAHEALLREWPRLRGWLDESRADVRMQRLLAAATAEWDIAGREPSYLLRGARLAQFAGWAEGSAVALTQDEHAYLETSTAERGARQAKETERQRYELEQARTLAEEQKRRAEAEEQRAEEQGRTAQRVRRWAVFLAGALLVAGLLAVYAFIQRQDARRQASIGLASQAALELEGSFPERAVVLALEALENYPYTWQAERALGQAILDSRLRQILPHGGIVNTAEWSADGARILTGSADGSVHLWDAVTGAELLGITEGAPTLASWSPDEGSILTVDGDGTTLTVWDAKSGRERSMLDEDDLGVLHVNLEPWEPWSPSGDRFLTYNADGRMTIWDAETASALQSMSIHSATQDQAVDALSDDLDNLLHLFLGEQGEQALWSPNGDLVVTSSNADGTVTVWDANTGEERYTFAGGFEDQSVLVAGWSPSGEHFATRGLGGAKVYDASTGRELFSISIPQVYIYRATWSPDGSQILTAGLDDRTARIWDAQSGQELFSMTGLDQVAGADWSAAGDIVAVGGQDGVVHVWDTVKGLEVARLFGTEPRIIKVTFSPDGERLLTVGDDNVVNIYDLSEALLRVVFPTGPLKYMSNVAWSPDGKQVALGREGGKARVWNAISGEQELVLTGHEDAIWWVAWSPAGDRIVTGSVDRTVRIWDSKTGIEQLTFTGHEDIIGTAEWSPDNSRIASNDLSGKVIVWDLSTGEQILTFSNHQGFIAATAWSPDGKRILSIGSHGEAFIWDTVTGEVLLELFPDDFDLDILAAAWTKDGKRVHLQSADGIVYTFDAASGKELFQFAMPRAEWSQMSLSPTEQRILKGSESGARVWNAETGVELLRYDVLPGFNDAVYSPDGGQAAVASHLGTLKIFPAWHSVQELIEYAKECCIIRELTAEEREQFGLAPQ